MSIFEKGNRKSTCNSDLEDWENAMEIVKDEKLSRTIFYKSDK